MREESGSHDCVLAGTCTIRYGNRFYVFFWDLMPTFEEMLRPKADLREMDGVSMLPLLENRKGQKEHEYLYFEFQELNGRQLFARVHGNLFI